MTTSPSIFGFHPVREALKNRSRAVIEVLVSAADGGRYRKLEDLARRQGVAWRRVTSAMMTELCQSRTHNGFAAVLDRTVTASRNQDVTDRDLVVLVEDVQDPRNLGGLLRVCEGVGAAKVLIRDRGSAPLSATVAKAAAGATEWLSIERITNSAVTIDRYKADGFWVFGAVTDGVAPWACDLSGKVMLCIGGEQKGLRPRTRGLCDHLITLPMRGRVGSLNLATAAAALLYEAVRQRGGGDK